MFCPVVFTYDNIVVRRSHQSTTTIGIGGEGQPRLETLNRKNNPQRGMRAIHVGLPRNASGFLVFAPSTAKIYNTLDVYFDEDFRSTLAYQPNTFPGHLDVTVTDPMPDTDLPFHHTGNPFMFAKRYPAGITQFAQAQAKEMFDEDLTPGEEDEPTLEEIISHRVRDQIIELHVKLIDNEQSYWTNINDLNDHYPRAVRQYMENNNIDEIVLKQPLREQEESESMEEDIFIQPNYDDKSEAGGAVITPDEQEMGETVEDEQQPEDEPPELMNQEDCESDDDSLCIEHDAPSPTWLRRSTRRRTPTDRLNLRAFAVESPNFSWIPRGDHITH
jgi:hypothetical protein